MKERPASAARCAANVTAVVLVCDLLTMRTALMCAVSLQLGQIVLIRVICAVFATSAAY